MGVISFCLPVCAFVGFVGLWRCNLVSFVFVGLWILGVVCFVSVCGFAGLVVFVTFVAFVAFAGFVGLWLSGLVTLICVFVGSGDVFLSVMFFLSVMGACFFFFP